MPLSENELHPSFFALVPGSPSVQIWTRIDQSHHSSYALSVGPLLTRIRSTSPKSWTCEDAHAFFRYHGNPVEKNTSLCDTRNSPAFQDTIFWSITDNEILWANGKPMEHHATICDLKISAERGCHLCPLFVGAMQREKGMASPNGERSRLWTSAIREAIDYEYIKRDNHDYRPLRLHDGDFWQVPRPDNFLAEIDVCRVKATKQHAVSRENSVRCPAAAEQVSLESSRLRWSLYTGSDAAIDLISAWLRQCTNGHEICQKNFSDHVPSRLLDLDGGLDAADIRLVLANGIGAQPYVTLSYTWGTSTSVSLIEDLIEAFQTSIPVMTLPKTIQCHQSVQNAASANFVGGCIMHHSKQQPRLCPRSVSDGIDICQLSAHNCGV